MVVVGVIVHLSWSSGEGSNGRRLWGEGACGVAVHRRLDHWVLIEVRVWVGEVVLLLSAVAASLHAEERNET